MHARTTNTAVEDLIEALGRCGLDAGIAPSSENRVVAVRVPGAQRSLRLGVASASAPSPTAVRELVQAGVPSSGRSRPVLPVLVADRLSRTSRAVLMASEWGWLDRRGHLRVVDPKGSLVLHTEIPALARHVAHRGEPLSTTVGLEVAVELLLDPGTESKVRELAGKVGRAASSVSVALRELRRDALVDDRNAPRVEVLFEAVAASWSSRSIPLATLPRPETVAGVPRLRAQLDDLEAEGWALTDTLAALVWGAPARVHAEYPPDLYVPDERVAARAIEHFGQAATQEARAARLVIPPISRAARHRQAAQSSLFLGDPWPLAHPLFVALELAQDKGRGVEILRDWTPKGFHRVW